MYLKNVSIDWLLSEFKNEKILKIKEIIFVRAIVDCWFVEMLIVDKLIDERVDWRTKTLILYRWHHGYLMWSVLLFVRIISFIAKFSYEF